MLNTERPSAQHRELDRYADERLIAALVDDQRHAVAAVAAAQTDLARAVEAAVPRLRGGGRLVYVGAGTSGRLGLLDSVELPPTFSWPPQRALALLAGGQRAMFEAIEGAEDRADQGALDIDRLPVNKQDVVLLIAASGTTPYVIGALRAARRRGALTIALANNPGTPIVMEADIGIVLDTGSEVISGSTRLKAGTAQKIALNTLSSAMMVRLNKVFGNLMVDVNPSNAKLYRRALDLTIGATGCSEDLARTTLEACGCRVKVAIVAILGDLGVAEAATRLDGVDGSVRAALNRRPIR
ncbi:N-acetylmuramic acid 6-phosphate etherase [Aquincola sp. S2]|uniref:N-acetylmuramic acid 6-phosphate etherase n=1 Tax=Pseudaquabacterium terrae TaxID=2732868 RepID=A0ABX2EN35_9BURK|nr:N-acetylmuramic acid 6-phosphate etherase [Aquabacterium terrae]NRF69988.1 N-acetylmuramic acid 6-phosphate etherase [Aquabacterium terrae]